MKLNFFVNLKMKFFAKFLNNFSSNYFFFYGIENNLLLLRNFKYSLNFLKKKNFFENFSEFYSS